MPHRNFRQLPERAVVIHGGMHKTGSSAVQNTFAQNADRLAEAGWLYPRAGLAFQDATGRRHRKLMIELRKNAGCGSWESLRKEIDAWPGRVIISHENFFSPQIDPKLLCEQLPGRDIYLMAYLRHPVDYLESSYREWVRRWRFEGSVDDYYERRRDYFELLPLVDAWTNALGHDRLLLRAYDRQRFVGGSVLSDMLSVLGIDGLSLPEDPVNNDSLNTTQTLVYQVANRLRASPARRDQLAGLMPDATEAATLLATLRAANAAEAGISASKLEALRLVLEDAAAPRRIMDDRLLLQVQQRHLADFSAVLAAGQDASASCESAVAKLPHDGAFDQPALREAIAHLLQ